LRNLLQGFALLESPGLPDNDYLSLLYPYPALLLGPGKAYREVCRLPGYARYEYGLSCGLDEPFLWKALLKILLSLFRKPVCYGNSLPFAVFYK
jgi:hypothetical protein